MLFLSRFFIPLILVTASLSAKSSTVSSKLEKKRTLADIDFIYNSFEKGYAPAECKYHQFGWTLSHSIQHAKEQISSQKNLGPKQLRSVLKQFFHSMSDYHVGVMFYSTEWARLPFFVKQAEGRYFFAYIDHSEEDPDHPLPFRVGDELIAMNRVPIKRMVKNLQTSEVGDNHEQSDLALATLFLTTRSGILGHAVPNGPVTLLWKDKTSKQLHEYTMEWDYQAELIAPPKHSLVCHAVSTPKPALVPQIPDSTFFSRQFSLPQYYVLKNLIECDAEVQEDVSEMLGSRKGFLPHLGPVVFETEESNPFYAYLFSLGNGKVGAYLRIGSFVADPEVAMTAFGDLIARFEKESDVMVLDQTNNPGGILLYVYALASMLSDRPLVVPKHREVITQENIYIAISNLAQIEGVKTDADAVAKFGESIGGYPVDMGFIHSIEHYSHQIIEEWSAGNHFTSPQDMYGINPIMPHPKAHYSKPILMLVNEKDFSGADFFPAIMQDNQRATIFGTRTAGAGGYFARAAFMNLSGIANFQYTASIAERPSGQLLENHGVTPDIVCELTVDDLQHEYQHYIKKVLEAVQKLIK